MRCPKCKTAVAVTDPNNPPGQCPRCGIVFLKLMGQMFAQLLKMQKHINSQKTSIEQLKSCYPQQSSRSVTPARCPNRWI